MRISTNGPWPSSRQKHPGRLPARIGVVEGRDLALRRPRRVQRRNPGGGLWEHATLFGGSGNSARCRAGGDVAARHPCQFRNPSTPPANTLIRGFTVIEMAVSGALMSIILFSAYLCFRSATVSQRLIYARHEALQQARVAMSLITADLRGACTLSKEFDFLGMKRSLGDVEADNLDFATHNYTPKKEHEADFCEVSYFLEKERESGIFVLWRRRDATPDDEPLSGGRREEIARGLLGLRFEYYDGFEWFEEWGDPQGKRRGQESALSPSNLSGMPEAVRITLLMDAAPKKTTDEASIGKDAAREPPLVFQSIARVLARPAPAAASSSTPSAAPTGTEGQPGVQQPPGGPG